MNNKGFITIAVLAIASVIAGVALAIAYNSRPIAYNEEPLGATIPTAVAVFETSLQAKITSSATSMTLVNGTDASGDSLSGYICFVIDEGTTSEEFVCGTASGTSITSMIRGIDPVDGDEEVADLKQAHRRGASVKITNHPQLAIVSRIVNGDETLPNLLQYGTTTTMTLDGHLASKKYVDDTVTAGAPDATESVKGLVEIASISELAAGTATGGTGANLCPHAEDFNSTSSAKQLVAVTESDGDIDVGFMELDVPWTFTSTVNINPASGWQLAGTSYTGSMADLNEAEAFFDGTDIIDTEAETLTDGSDADALHVHDTLTGLTSTIAELNKLDGYTGSVNELNEMDTFFDATDISGGEAEDLTDGNDSSAHYHKCVIGHSSRTSVAGAGNQDITHNLGSTPHLVTITTYYDYTSNNEFIISRGHATSASDEECQVISMGPATSPNAEQVASTIICLEDPGSTDRGRATLTTLNATTMTLNWTTAVTANEAFLQYEICQ